MQAAYFDTVRETIDRHGGRLEKFIGDAAMAVFGVPLTRDDDAERAVRAALALTAAVEQLSARIGLEAARSPCASASTAARSCTRPMRARRRRWSRATP